MALFLFILGLFIGSFLGVIIDRLPRRESIWFGRSHCDFCKHALSWFDLIPLFSFIAVSGKCRYCKKFIGWRFPIIELSTALLFSLIPQTVLSNSIMYQVVSIKYILLLLYYLFIVSSMIVIFYIDLFDGIIPDVILITISIVTLLYMLLTTYYLLLPHFISALVAFALFLFLTVITKGKGMGFGDVKFSFVIGFLLGFPGNFVALYMAFLSGAFVSTILLIQKKKKLKSTIAFGPFLVLGTLATLFWGNTLWIFFLHAFLRLPYS